MFQNPPLSLQTAVILGFLADFPQKRGIYSLQIMLPPGIRTKSVWLVSLKEGADESGLTEREGVN